jgi:hypothetical protein
VGAAAQSEEAVTAPMTPVAFTGSLGGGPPAGQRIETVEEVDGHVERRGGGFEFDLIGVSDPRIGGRMIRLFEDNEYPGPDGADAFVIQTMTIRIVNDGGAWQGSRHYFGDKDADDQVDSVMVLTGEGDYEGLFAAFDDSEDFREFRGVIFPDPPPPAPVVP